jgi:protease-4
MPNGPSWRKAPALSAAVLLSGCISITLVPTPGPLQEEQIGGSGKDKILVVELSGLISSHEESGVVMERPSMIARAKEELNRAAQDPRIKAMVVRINSPGGTVTASDVLHHEIVKFKEKRKIPVVASIMDVGASGGYYVAVAADKIIAHPSTVTGSVGVIMLSVNARGLLEKIGVETTAVASGPKKDMGSPFRPMTEEERQIFQGVIDVFYERFLTVIRDGRRNLNAEQIRKLADGRIYSGEQARALGLVDEVGYLDDAIEMAKREARLDEARLVTYRRPGEYRNNIYSAFSGGSWALTAPGDFSLMALVRGGTPQFMYLWMP